MNGTLWLYFLLVLGIIALPGLDMAYVVANALSGGRGAGLAAVAGIVAGGICHTLLLVAGAAYIGWIGWNLARAGATTLEVGRGAPAQPPVAVFAKGMLTCLLNPKAYVFMLAVFPQFLRPAQGPIWVQATALGLITAATQAGVYGTVALLARRAGGSLGASSLATRTVGMLLLGTGVFTVLQGWQA